MAKKTIKIIVLFVVLGLLTIAMFGCAETEEDNHLWVLTDSHPSSTYYMLIERIMATFKEDHPEVTIEVESIPTALEERDIFLERVRSQIMAGEGPDVYLMSWYTPLFSDVEHSMHNGAFQDISAYYNADDELPKDRMSQSIMESGVLDGKRYVLPLNFNVPVLYVDKQQVENAGLDVNTLGTGLSGLSDVVKALGSEALIAEPAMLYYYLPNMFSSLIDYKEEKAVWDKKELVVFLNDYRALMTEINAADIPYALGNMGTHISNGDYWAQNGHCVYMGTLTELVDNLRLAKAEETDLAIIPIRTASGAISANVTNYGAIGAGTGSPKLAYEFLRNFLLEENQWENNIVDSPQGSLLTGNWPVLTDGSWSDANSDIWRKASQITGSGSEATARKNALKFAELTEGDFEVILSTFDVVYFPVHGGTEYMQVIIENLNPYMNPAAGEVDMGVLADKLIDKMQHHLSEG